MKIRFAPRYNQFIVLLYLLQYSITKFHVDKINMKAPLKWKKNFFFLIIVYSVIKVTSK